MTPNALYKYRTFNERTLTELLEDKVFYANPTSFNDPMDTRPHLDVDVDEEKLEKIWKTLTRSNIIEEARTSVKYPVMWNDDMRSEIENIANVNNISAFWMLRDHIEHEISRDCPPNLLVLMVESLLKRQHNMGLVCLSENWNCPLMWSHYGNQHHGICIGYNIIEDQLERLDKVTYTEDRNVKVSLVEEMIRGSHGALVEIERSVNLRKAVKWQYENEWRLRGGEGYSDTPDGMNMNEVFFGIRCPDVVRYAVMRALADREKEMKFYEMVEVQGKFELERRQLSEHDEKFRGYPIYRRTAEQMFGPPPPPRPPLSPTPPQRPQPPPKKLGH